MSVRQRAGARGGSDNVVDMKALGDRSGSANAKKAPPKDEFDEFMDFCDENAGMLVGLILIVLGFVLLVIAWMMCAQLRARAFPNGPRGRIGKGYAHRQFNMFASLWWVGLGMCGVPAMVLLYQAYSGDDQWIGKIRGVLTRFAKLKVVNRVRKAAYLMRWRAKEMAEERRVAQSRTTAAGAAPTYAPTRAKNMV
uniref:Transmembrane protein n=1 Tax=Prasinoderma coloniale TaxID=156133 RepID=A0A7R9TUE5_9VIRI|mmetsp:Transcript_6727/g.27441  ORF Transcript_6727/g.27441 Transcript_6727/m.27441 type:complete len:195 (+) Transcript_6727:225-809(+)